jgi:peptidoglycan/xylan/chitin deacetylase (PgdA/CDA1 family)
VGYPVFNGNVHVPEIALSFDDGPNPPYTSQVLDVLSSYHVQATFFVIGIRVTYYPDLVRQGYEQGNAIGNHTWTHPELTRLSADDVFSQLQQTSNEIKSVIGSAPTVFRPPYEEYNASVQSIAASLGLSTVLWNVDPRDWALPGTNAIIANVLNNVHDGSIIEMHDGGGNRGETVAALPTIITTLEQRGFRFVTIPRLIEDLSTASAGASQSQIALAELPSIDAILPSSSAFLEEKRYDE